MTSAVTIIDYGIGNLLSVSQALIHVGATVNITSDPQEIESADRLLLPGVGAFKRGMNELQLRELIDPILAFGESGRPFLGICLGMQIMLDSSNEFGNQSGLGLIPGHVTEIPKNDIFNEQLKVPHIGWNQLRNPGNQSWTETILSNTPHDSSVYFVHSYAAYPRHSENILAVCDYGGMAIPAVIQFGSYIGCQFHPEKSGTVGLEVLKLFSQN